jgi:hypothetical protein
MLKGFTRSPPHQKRLEGLQLPGKERSVELKVQVEAADSQDPGE